MPGIWRAARLGLLLAWLAAQPVSAGGAGGPIIMPTPSLVWHSIRLTGGPDGLSARRGTRLLWKNSSLIVWSLQPGPGHWVTAQGLPLPFSAQTAGPTSLVLDPQSGKVVARAGGSLVYQDAARAVFADLLPGGLFTQADAPLLRLNRLPLKTFRSETRTLFRNQVVPAACRGQTHQTDTGNFGVSASFSGASLSSRGRSVVWSLDNAKCSLRVRIDIDTFRTSLLSLTVRK
ncbi:hypothetical protein [Deinococcus sp.]|uniref:hypothetical protein n=1 Tax=Deinococcus sp. TaxID=47478 RepID=UPI003CC5D3E5